MEAKEGEGKAKKTESGLDIGSIFILLFIVGGAALIVILQIITGVYDRELDKSACPVYNVTGKPTLTTNSSSADIVIRNPTNRFTFHFFNASYALSRYPTIGVGRMPSVRLSWKESKLLTLSSPTDKMNEFDSGSTELFWPSLPGDTAGDGDDHMTSFGLRISTKVMITYPRSMGSSVKKFKVVCSIKLDNKTSEVTSSLCRAFFPSL